MKVGFVGLGGMGSAMAANLLKAGHEVTVWSRRPEPAERLRELGARVVDSPNAAFKGDAFLSMLSDDAAVRANIESWAAAVSGEAPYRFSPDEIMDNARILEGVVWSSRNGSAEVALDAL